MTDVERLKKRIAENKKAENKKSIITYMNRVELKKLNAEVKTNNKKYGLELEEVISDCISGQNIIKKDTIFRVSNVADVFYDVKFLGRDKNSNKIYFELILYSSRCKLINKRWIIKKGGIEYV